MPSRAPVSAPVSSSCPTGTASRLIVIRRVVAAPVTTAAMRRTLACVSPMRAAARVRSQAALRRTAVVAETMKTAVPAAHSSRALRCGECRSPADAMTAAAEASTVSAAGCQPGTPRRVRALSETYSEDDPGPGWETGRAMVW
jgi:hypothetical protein